MFPWVGYRATYEKQYWHEERKNVGTNTIYHEYGRSEEVDVFKEIKEVRTESVAEDAYKKYIEWTEEERQNKESAERILQHGHGLFNEHIGFSPVMKPDADPGLSLGEWQQNVRFMGYGESNRLMGMYIQHKMIESAGLAQTSQPFYSKKLWDDRGSWIDAPTIRGLTDIAVTVAVAVGTGGTGLPALLASAGLNLVDDTVFTMMDVAYGMDAGQAFSSLGKKALSSATSTLIGAGFNGVTVIENGKEFVKGGLVNLGGGAIKNSVVGSSLMKGLESMTTNVVSSAINAMDFTQIGTGNFFNRDAFTEGAFGRSAMAGVLSGVAGSLVTGGLNSRITDDSLFGFSGKHIGGVRNLTSTMGGLASTAVTLGITGNATVNFLNTSMFGARSGTGLFEFSFGRDGLQSRIGMGGTDLNLGKLASSLSGMNVLYQNHRINSYAKESGNEAQVALRALYSYGDREGKETYKELVGGKTDLVVDAGMDGPAETVAGADGKKTIYLKSLGDSAEERLRAGLVLQHEAYRDGEQSGDQEAETLRAVTGHSEMAKRMLLEGSYAGAILSDMNLMTDLHYLQQGADVFASYVGAAYDSSADYWKLMKDESIEWDGNLNLYDESGNAIDAAEGQLMDYKELSDLAMNLTILGFDKNEKVVLDNGQEVTVGDLQRINEHNFGIVEYGNDVSETSYLENITSHMAAAALLEDGHMSMEESIDIVSSLINSIPMGATVDMITHWSTRYVLNNHNEFLSNEEKYKQIGVRDDLKADADNEELIYRYFGETNMKLYSTSNSILHSPPGDKNYKWCEEGMGRELVFDMHGDIEMRPEFIGTNNFSGGFHLGMDVVSWLKWGNSPDDTTTQFQRLGMFVIDGGKEKAKNALRNAQKAMKTIDNSIDGIEDPNLKIWTIMSANRSMLYFR